MFSNWSEPGLVNVFCFGHIDEKLTATKTILTVDWINPAPLEYIAPPLPPGSNIGR